MSAASESKATIGSVQQSWVTRVARLTRKELRETLRDRRTIVTLVLMPLLLYPLISLVFKQFMVDYTVLGGLVQVGAIRPTKVTLYSAATKKPARELRVWSATGRRLLRRSFLKNHMGYVALQSEIQSQLDQREAAVA